MAKFKPGETKKGGRVLGTKNRNTTELQAALLKLLDDNLANLQTDITGMKGKDRATLLLSLAKHVTPAAMNPEKLTEEQMLQIIQFIKSEMNEKS